MAFGTPTHLVVASNKTSANSLTLSMGGSSVASGSQFLILVIAAFDNIGTAAGDNSDITSVTDTGGNTYTKVKEQTNAGSAAAAVTTSVWIADAVNAVVATTGSITINFSGNTAAKVASAFKIPKSSTATLEVGATNSSSADGAATGASLAVTPPDNREWLFVRVDGCEQTSDNGAAWAAASSTGWDGSLDGGSTTGGGAASNILLAAEYDVSTTGSAKTSNPGDGNLPSCDWAAVIACIKEVVSTPSVGRADETDTASARGAALGTNRANETDTASAIFPKVVIATGMASTTNTAFNLGLTLGASRADEADTAFALSQGVVQLPVGQANETDTAFKAGGIAMAPNRPIETDSAFNLATVLQPQRADEADTAFARPQLGGVGLAVETDTAFALGKVFVKQVGFVSVANGDFDSNYLSEYATFDATIAVVAGRLRVTAQQSNNIQATATFPSIGEALRTGNIVQVSGASFSGTAPATVRLGNGATNAPGQPYLNTSFSVETVLTGTSVKIDCSLNDMGAVTIGQFGEFDNFVITEIPLEVDTAFALNRLDTPAWSFSSETDTAFLLVPGFPASRANEADTAFARTAVFIRAVDRSNEADTALALTAVQIKPVGFTSTVNTALQPGVGWAVGRGSEVDSAFARSALIFLPIGRADEVDTAFQMFGALEAGSGRKPYINLGNFLRNRRQPVHKTV